MTDANETPPAGRTIRPETLRLIEAVSGRYGIAPRRAGELIRGFLSRQRRRPFADGWWAELLDAQFVTHVGPHARVLCGREVHLAHLAPGPGELCHDCGCARGEYHVPGCDSEECPICGGQAFCCGCPTPSSAPDPRGRAA